MPSSGGVTDPTGEDWQTLWGHVKDQAARGGAAYSSVLPIKSGAGCSPRLRPLAGRGR
jgi:hypothetical protein